MFERSKAEENAHKKEIKTKEEEIIKLEAELEEIKSNRIYDNAFEWRFEFPEVLADNGDFIGFDVVIGNPPYIQLQKGGGRLGTELERFNYQTFTKTGDIYTLFIERGNHILSQGGRISYIISNKWMRASYGQNTRLYLKNYMNTEYLIDMGGVQIFDEATVDTNIIISQKSEPQDITSVYTLDSNFKKNDDFTTLVNSGLYETKSLNTTDSWLISSPMEESIKIKIKSIGYPLGNTEYWDLKINFGIKTGFNEAFIIDGKTKEVLIKEDPKNVEILKPILRGQDTKRYRAKFADLWLIATHNGYNTEERNVERINVKDYPTIKNHLDKYWAKIVKRSDKGDTPYNLRNCTYVEDFAKEKIIWKRIGSIIRFSYSDEIEYSLDSTAIASGSDLKFLTGMLNSKLHIKELLDNSPKTGTGDAIISVQALTPHLVAKPEMEYQKPIIDLVDQILEVKKADPNDDTTELEQEIDMLVYKLYDLTYDEVLIVDPETSISREVYGV